MEWYLTWWRLTTYRKIKELECALWSGIVKSHLFKLPQTLIPVQVEASAAAWGAQRGQSDTFGRVNIDWQTEKQRKTASGDRFEITVGHEGHSLVLIVHHGAACSILTSCLTSQYDLFHFLWEKIPALRVKTAFKKKTK